MEWNIPKGERTYLGELAAKQAEYAALPIVFWPRPPQWINYVEAVTLYPFGKYLVNSIIQTVPSTFLTVISSALGGFGFARRQARLRNALFILVLSMLMVPRVVTTIPTFIVFLDGMEKGRIVEVPAKSVEEDLVEIIER